MRILDAINSGLETPIQIPRLMSMVFITADLSRRADSVHGIAACTQDMLSEGAPLLSLFEAMPRATQEFEQLPDFMLNVNRTRQRAMEEFTMSLLRDGDEWTFVASNATEWSEPLWNALRESYPILQELSVQWIDLKQLYSCWRDRAVICDASTPYAAMREAKQLKKREGLHEIVRGCGIAEHSMMLPPVRRTCATLETAIMMLLGLYDPIEKD